MDDKVGWVVDQGDFDALLRIISNLKSEPKYITEQRKLDCRERAEKLYDKDIKFNEYFELYKKIIGGNN